MEYFVLDCIECMACSDNVIRAGLTPKYKDVETLCSMLNYRGEPAKNKLFQPVNEDSYCQLFKPPVPDFAVVKIEVKITIFGFGCYYSFNSNCRCQQKKEATVLNQEVLPAFC